MSTVKGQNNFGNKIPLFLRLQKLGRISLNCAGHNMFSRKKFKGKEKTITNTKVSKQTRFLKIQNSYFGNTLYQIFVILPSPVSVESSQFSELDCYDFRIVRKI